MKNTEITIIIKIISGKTCGLSYTAITVPDDIQLNHALREMIKERAASVEVEKVLCKKKNGGFAVSFSCKIDNIEDANIVLSYNITEAEYNNLNFLFSKENNPKKTRNNSLTVNLIQQIMDTYNYPHIEINSKE